LDVHGGGLHDESASSGGSKATRAGTTNVESLVSSHLLEPGIARQAAGRAFVTMRGHEIRPPGDAAAVVGTLLAASARGEADASYRIYLIVNQCENAVSPLAMSENEATRKVTPSWPKRVATLMGECERLLTDPAIPRRAHWLTLAAEQGSVEAAVVYSLDIEQIVGGPSEWAAHPERVIEYKRRGMAYLQQAAARGSVDALSALSESYEAGFKVPADLAKALAYRMVIEQVDPSEENRWFVSRLSARVTTAQKQHAKQQAAVIREQCCINR